MLLFLAIVFILIFGFGVALHFLGGLIYIFLVLAIISGIAHLLRGSRA